MVTTWLVMCGVQSRPHRFAMVYGPGSIPLTITHTKGSFGRPIGANESTPRFRSFYVTPIFWSVATRVKRDTLTYTILPASPHTTLQVGKGLASQDTCSGLGTEF